LLVTTRQIRLLVVDDEPAAARTTAELLQRAGYSVEVKHSGQEALAAINARAPDLMLLDYEMPDLDGPEVLEQLQQRGRVPFPVLILTGARLAPSDQVLGLERGATDYLLKGIDRQVLLARIKVALRQQFSEPATLQRGRLRIDPAAATAWIGDRRLNLERKPFGVLYRLALREGEAVSRSDLLREVWDTEFKGFQHSVDQAVYTLRRELQEPGWIETVHGHGYRFVTLG
jgi:DNA-binding response OmpR family regulator